MATQNAINVTFPLSTTFGGTGQNIQSAFLGAIESTDSNVTGAGTVYQLGTNVAFTEIYDVHSDFNTNGTFQAPVNGYYYFAFSVLMGGITVLMTKGCISLVTTTSTMFFNNVNIGIAQDITNQYGFSGSTGCYMAAGNTAVLKVTISNGLFDTADILGASYFTNGQVLFSGYLIS